METIKIFVVTDQIKCLKRAAVDENCSNTDIISAINRLNTYVGALTAEEKSEVEAKVQEIYNNTH